VVGAVVQRSLTALRRRWNGFWFAPASPYPIAAFRILLGLYLTVYIGLHAPHATLLFSSDGVFVPYLVPDYAPPPLAAAVLCGLLWLLCLALLFGVACRWTIPLLLLLYAYHYFLALGVKHSSFERLIPIYLLALAPGRSDSVWALQPTAAGTVQFTGRLVRFQTIALYAGAGLWKLINPDWRSGVLLHATLQGIWATPLAYALVRLGFSDSVWQWISWAVIGGELLLATLLTFPRTRTLGIALGALFHLGNSVILAIPEFLVCLAPYPLFLAEQRLERLAGWFRNARFVPRRVFR
jgi:hypothetical protein